MNKLGQIHPSKRIRYCPDLMPVELQWRDVTWVTAMELLRSRTKVKYEDEIAWLNQILIVNGIHYC